MAQGVIYYTIHEPVSPSHDLLERADDLIFIKEGFSWPALFFPLLWLLYHRMWLVLVGYFAILVFVGLGATYSGMSEAGETIVFLLINLLFAYEANDLRRWYLGLKGYHMIASVAGNNRSECERRFFNMWLPRIRAGSQPAMVS